MANQDIIYTWGLTNRALPGAQTDNSYSPIRLSRRGEVVSQPLDRRTLSNEGTYFVSHNVTNDASATLAGHAAPLLADADATMTKPLVFCRNPSASTSQLRCVIDFIEIEVVTAGANGTQACWAAQLDTGASRYSSGSVETLVPVNCNMQSNSSAVLVTLAGPVTVGAESSAVRYLGFGTHRPSIEVAGDKYLFVFGSEPNQAPTVAAASVRNFLVNLGPVILGPTDQLLLALHGQASQSAAGVYKVRMGWFER